MAFQSITVMDGGGTWDFEYVQRAKKSVYKNSSNAVSDFIIYAIYVDGNIWKVGEGDSTNQRTDGTPERIAQQIQLLTKYAPIVLSKPSVRVTSRILESLPNSTTNQTVPREQHWISQLNSPQNTTVRAKLKLGQIR